jgi:hypothetical protein
MPMTPNVAPGDHERTRNRWLLGIAISLGLFLLPRTSPALARCLVLVVIFGVLVRPVLALAIVRRGEVTRDLAALLLLVAAVSGYGFFTWPKPRYLELSEKQQSRFVTVLRERKPQKRVVLGCAASEEVCVAAVSFIGLFQQAAWRVRGNRLERGYLGIPASGVNVLVFGEGTIPDPDNPRYGLWVPFVDPDRDIIVKAFESIGLTVRRPQADSALPPNDIGVFFGPEP